MRRALLVVAAALAGCVSGRDCAKAIPDDLRADVLRFVVERKLCRQALLPQEDLDLAMTGGGRPLEQLDDETRRRVTLYANGYVSCVKERIER